MPVSARQLVAVGAGPFGRGLMFVDRLADRWGLSLDGKTAVWLEVDTPQAL